MKINFARHYTDLVARPFEFSTQLGFIHHISPAGRYGHACFALV
jgi:hypothetical protein